MDRRLVWAAAVAIFAGSVPHTIYHFTTIESDSTGDNTVSNGGLFLQTVIPLMILYLARASARRPRPPGRPAQATPKEA